MTNTKTLLIDMDAIVADLATEWYARWNKKAKERWLNDGLNGTPFKPLLVDDVKAWDVAKTVGDNRIYDILKEPGLYRAIKPFPAAQKAVRALFDLKLDNGKPAFNIVFLTASITAPHILMDKALWMADHFPYINPRQMIYAYQKELVRGDFFIDDSPKNLKNWKAAWPDGVAITIDYPYNQTADVSLRARSYKNMDEAWAMIQRYLESMAIFREGYQFP